MLGAFVICGREGLKLFEEINILSELENVLASLANPRMGEHLLKSNTLESVLLK